MCCQNGRRKRNTACDFVLLSEEEVRKRRLCLSSAERMRQCCPFLHRRKRPKSSCSSSHELLPCVTFSPHSPFSSRKGRHRTSGVQTVAGPVLFTFASSSFQSPRSFSTGQLHMLPHVHPPPITRSSAGDLTDFRHEGSHLGARFTLRCFQRLSLPNIATRRMLLAEQPVHQRSVQPGPLVLRSAPLKTLTPAADRDRTVSRRSEPSSRTALMGEQPNPWEQIHPQDATSRHRGAKPCRRCERLGKISLLSPG